MSEAEFWRSTPFQTQIHIEASADRHIAAYRMTVWGAYHAGVFSRIKKIPPLEEVLRGIDRKKRKPMSPDELLRAFEMINIRSGGKDLRKQTAH